MVFIDHLKLLKLPTFQYRQVRGDMTDMYKILSGKYDTAVTPRVTRNIITSRGEMILGWRKIDQNTTCANTFLLTGLLIFGVVYHALCDTVKKSYLDKFWHYQDIVYDYKAEIHGTGSRSSYY